MRTLSKKYLILGLGLNQIILSSKVSVTGIREYFALVDAVKVLLTKYVITLRGLHEKKFPSRH